jgi:anti-anti-sigma regulatory factor
MLEQLETHTLIQVTGEATVGTAAGLKIELLDALASGRDLRADLSEVEEIDLTAVQLFWAAAREADASHHGLTVQVSQAAEDAARELGFDRFPGAPQVV